MKVVAREAMGLLPAARLPVVDRYVAGALAGKSTALITNLRSAPQPIGHQS